MNRSYSKGKRLAIYLLVFAFAALAFVLLIFVYAIKSSIAFDVSSAAPIISESANNGKLNAKMTHSSFNAYVDNFINDYAPVPENIKIYGTACFFKEASGENADKIYVNLINENIFPNVVFSFIAEPAITFGDNTVKTSVSNIKFGKYELPVLGGLLWDWMELPHSAVKEAKGLIRPAEIDADTNGGVSITYVYDEKQLTDMIASIVSLSDDRKLQLHRINQDVDEWLIALCQNKTATYNEAEELINRFEQNPETFFELCMLLSNDGINVLCENFGDNYYNFMSSDRLAELSDYEINRDINEYHRNFSKGLLQYLYDNPNYYVQNGELFSNGAKITAESVISAKGGGYGAYTTRIKADNNTLSAVYTLSGYETERIIFSNIVGGGKL